MYNMIQTGERIRNCRLSHHITQEQAAEALSISLKHYSEIERGVTGLSFEIFIKICELYSCSSDYLLFDNNDGIPAVLIERVRNCPIETQKRLLAIFETIIGLTDLDN